MRAGGGAAIGADVGTSFAAPKVAHIAATLQRLFPNDGVNLYRALIAQSARLPNHLTNPSVEDIRHYGYGIPSLQRATENGPNRVTLIASDNIAAKRANVYSIKVPEALRSPAEDNQILIEVTLAYMAGTRRARIRTSSYLSTWLDWRSSKIGESRKQFEDRIIQEMDSPQETGGQDCIPWIIRERTDWGKIGLKRQDSTLQKSWCLLPQHRLPEELCIAVVGHKGWEQDLDKEVPYSIVVSFESLNADIPVYQMIEAANIEVPTEVEVEQEVTVETQ